MLIHCFNLVLFHIFPAEDWINTAIPACCNCFFCFCF